MLPVTDLELESLAQMIRHDEGIKGGEIAGGKHKIGLLSDDKLIYVKKPNKCFHKLMSVQE